MPKTAPTDTDTMDAEANRFAMELLMPLDLLKVDVAGIDILDDRAFAKLANKYQVPAATMAFHIGTLRAEGDL